MSRPARYCNTRASTWPIESRPSASASIVSNARPVRRQGSALGLQPNPAGRMKAVTKTIVVFTSFVLLVAACTEQGSDPPDPAPSSPAAATTSTSFAPSIATTVTTPSTTQLAPVETPIPSPEPTDLLEIVVERDIEVPGGVPMDVFRPIGPGPWPTIVLFHGGGWFSGQKEDVEPLARQIAANGAVVFNAGYEVLLNDVSFPETFEQTACAVVAAGALAGQYGGIENRLTVVGYSAGAHLGALAAFSSGRFTEPCAGEGATEVVGFVGISGPYDSDVFPQLLLNFGSSRDDDPDLWAAGNPYTYLPDRPDLDVLLLHGDLDFVVAPAMSTWFSEALVTNGNPVELVIDPDLDHFSIVDIDQGGAETARQVAAHATRVARGG